jgi:uroporphyrin-III C-methyltransferase
VSKAEKPVLIIQNGTHSKEKVGIGTVNTIQSVVAAKV